MMCLQLYVQWNPDFLTLIFLPVNNLNVVPLPQSHTVVLLPVFLTLQFLEPVFISLVGLKNRDFTVVKKFVH